MKIGINARFLVRPYTGIGQYTRNLINHLAKIDSVNEYFLFVPSAVEVNLPDNFNIIRLPEKDYKSASLRKAHWEHKLVPDEMEKLGINLAHFLYPSNPNRRLSFPVVVTVHDVIPWRLKAYKKRIRSKVYHLNAKMALKKADHLITVSKFSKQEIIDLTKIEEKNISVTYLAAPEPDHPIEVPTISLRRDYLLYVGGYDDRKNVPALIEAYQKHIGNIYSIDLILVGGKDKGLESTVTDKYLGRIADKIPIKPKGRVIFTEPFLQSELITLFRQAKAFVHVSFYEGFNIPLVEAMASGTPIVASDIPVNHEVTDDNAHFVDPASVDHIGVGIHELINNTGLMKKLEDAGLKRAKDFSWEKCAEETLDVYNLFG